MAGFETRRKGGAGVVRIFNDLHTLSFPDWFWRRLLSTTLKLGAGVRLDGGGEGGGGG